MTHVMVSGWEIGFNKVKFTRLLMTELGYSLTEAKKTTDVLLEDRPVELTLSESQVDNLLSEMRRLGARCDATVGSR